MNNSVGKLKGAPRRGGGLACAKVLTKGFTLIELLVVVAIIALLLAILMPALGEARRQARTMACGTNLRTCGQAMVYYLQANKDVYCGGNWAERLFIYVQKASKSQKIANYTLGNSSNGVAKIEFYLCPGDEFYHGSGALARRINGECVRLDYAMSYGINNSLMYRIKSDMLSDVLASNVPGTPSYAYGYLGHETLSVRACDGENDYLPAGMRKSGTAERKGDVLLMMDSGNDDVTNGTWYFNPLLHAENASRLNEECTNLQVHHKTGNNFLYADGHVGYVKVLPNAYQHNVPPWPWAWIPLNGWTVNRQTNQYNPYGQDYSKY
jgi:prepilin-type N-terminal cleavage/methylation domain-containing protein/prepilin-type processing-associated H-X9-DG protein